MKVTLIHGTFAAERAGCRASRLGLRAKQEHRVVRPAGLHGEHWFELEPAEGATVVRHTIEGCASGKYEVIWRERIEPLHDLILEALLENVAAAAAAGP